MIHVHAAAGKNTRNAAVNKNEPEIITSATYIYLILTDQKKIPVLRRWVQFQRTGQRGRRWAEAAKCAAFGVVVEEMDAKQVRSSSLLDLGKFIDNR